jgi:hypothetical protein
MANGHWDDLTDRLDLAGRALADELMTGVASGSNYLSHTTVQSLRDIGFEVTPPIWATDGDVNWDGQVNGLDVPPFVEWLVGGRCLATADMNQDHRLDGLDVPLFVGALVAAAERSTGGVAVPEPGGHVLAFPGLVVLLVRAQRARSPRVRATAGMPHRETTR